LCRRTRQIVAWVVGDHSEATCQRLWEAIPVAYRRCHSFSDFWRVHAAVFPTATHQQVSKDNGQTAHQERWHNTLRRPLARFTCETLAFSKLDMNHEFVLRWYIIEHNLRMRPSLTQ
jgi:IS1 family transposase